jgi:ribosome-associated heat shock protein Hsp15
MTDKAPRSEAGTSSQRLDRWLWFARFFKTRTLASTIVTQGKVRVNGERVSRAARLVKPGDVLTFPAGSQVRVIEITGIGARRGPAPEAQALYEDHAPPVEQSKDANPASEPKLAARDPGSGRPSKRERRQTSALKDVWS